MTKDKNREFINKVESLVKPEDVTAISFLGDFNKYLPKKMQHRLMEKGSKIIPYMGFIIDPYCFFLSYEITDIEAAQKMLPEGYELVDTAVFKTTAKKPMVIFSIFTARTSAFIGMRLEAYIIARNKKTGFVSWIIADYVTNTNSHDPKNGFCGYNSDPAVYTVTPYGELLVDVKGSADKACILQVDLNKGEMKELDEDLWIEGNTSIDYGGELKSNDSTPFSLIFDIELMREAKSIPLENLQIKTNSFMSGIIDPQKPLTAALFPYSQHFIIRQDIKGQKIDGITGLEKLSEEFLNASGFKTMKGDDIKKPLFRGMGIMSALNVTLILFLLFMLLFR